MAENRRVKAGTACFYQKNLSKKEMRYMVMIRQVIEIDEEKCNGCGACASACQEGAIEIGRAHV